MRRETMKWIALSGVGLTTAAVLVYGAFDGDAERAVGSTEAEPEIVTRHEAERCRFQPDQGYAWTLSGEDVGEVDLGAFGFPSKGTNDVGTTVTANLSVRVLQTNGESAVLVGRFAEVDSSALEDDARLEAPFLLEVSERCAIKGFAHHRETNEGIARVQQAMLHDLSWTIPTDDATTFEWTNTFGSLRSTVVEADGATGRSYRKSFDALTAWESGLGQPTRVENGSMVVERTEGWFDRVQLESVYTGQGTTITRSLMLERVPFEPASLEAVATNESDYRWANLLPRQPEGLRPATARTNKASVDALRGADFETAMREHEARIDADVPIQRAWVELRDFLEANPDDAEKVVERLKSGEIPTSARMATYIALGNADTPQAREALESIMDDSKAPSFERIRAMLNLIDRPDVGVEFASKLASNSTMYRGQGKRDHMVARHSIMALGAMSARKPEDDAIRDVATRTVSQALETHDEPEVLSVVYRSLANIGDPSMLQQVESVMDDPDYKKRVAAAVVTRRMHPEDSAEFTQRWLEREDDWRVKEAIYMVLEKQTFTAREPTTEAVMRLALRDLRQRPTVITRKAIVRLLGRADLADDDPLRAEIQETFLEILPYEVSTKSGLYLTLAAEIDDPTKLREALSTLYGDGSTASPGVPGGPQLGGPEVAQ